MTRPLLVLLITVIPAAAAAQPVPGPAPNAHCVTLAVHGGASFAGGGRGPTYGAASQWELVRRLSLEGKASWFERGPGSELFAATINAVATVARVERTQVFVKGGVGVLTASLDTGREAPPEFYARRLGPSRPGQSRNVSFTDPAAAIGGGVSIQVNRYFSIRPEVETLLAWRGGRTLTSPGMSVHLAYHFERHIVTPAVGR